MVGCYAELARALPPGRAVFGVQAQGVDGRAPLLGSVDAMADRYLDAIATVTGGPWVLGGWSMGAVIAHAMATRAHPVAAARVGPLVALDQTPTEVRRDVDDAALLVEIVGDAIPLEVRALRALAPYEQVRFVLDEAARRGLPIAGLEEDDVLRHIEVCKTSFRALLAHVPPQGAPIDVLLLRARERPDWEAPGADPEAEWRVVTPGRVALHLVGGDHVSMVKRPHVAALAALLATELSTSVPSLLSPLSHSLPPSRRDP